MKNIASRFAKIQFTEKSAPLAFLVIAVFGFGLLANQLGYYQDD